MKNDCFTRLAATPLVKNLPFLTVCAFIGSAYANPTDFFRSEDAVAYTNCVKTIRNVQRGEFYTVCWDGQADYHTDRMLASGCTSSVGMIAWACSNVLNQAPVPQVVTDLGCSAFAATNAMGAPLAGRNFDYRYRMSHALVHVPRNAALDRPYASVSTVDTGWVGYDIGGLDSGTNDLSYVALFPHLPLDGMNEKGLMVTVLSLDARTNGFEMTEQYHPDRSNVVTTVAIRYLLDHADSTEAAVNLLTNRFNMFFVIGEGIPIKANYHFFVNDKTGDARVVEWLPPTDGSRNWTPWITNATAVSNFYLYDGYGHGSNRWEILRHALACQQGHLEESGAIDLCRAVAQKKGAEQTSWTHWSVVYNLADLTANIATLGNYDEIFPYRLDPSAGADWTVGEAKSARLNVETNLPPFDPLHCESGKVYLKEENEMGTFQGASEVMSRVGVSAVNRSGVACDSAEAVNSRIVKADFGANRALVYVVSPASSTQFSQWADDAVAGVNDKGVSARVVHFAAATGTGSLPASHALCRALVWCPGASVADIVAYLQGELPLTDGSGVVFTDAKGNVAVWPAGGELAVDDASEMIRNSLDLRKGIYEIDGAARGQFDELPGLLRLAATDRTRAVVSMGYGCLDVVLPETNVIWRAELADANIPAYGVIAEPPSVADATATLTDVATGAAPERNSQGRAVSRTNASLKVEYRTTGDDLYFADGCHIWSGTFAADGTVATPPAPAAPTTGTPQVKLGAIAQRYPWNGWVDIRYKTPFANASATVTFRANDVTIGRAPGTSGLPFTASFDFNAIPEFADKRMKEVRFAATVGE